MNTYMAEATITLVWTDKTYTNIFQTPFTANDDTIAANIGHKYRASLADAYTRGEPLAIRLKVYSLEIGTWNQDNNTINTTKTRLILDTDDNNRT